MSEFSSQDINDARRRVEEMHRRAREVVDRPAELAPSDSAPASAGDKSFGISSLLSGFGINLPSGDSSLILAIILILSREGADNMLILALLYILL